MSIYHAVTSHENIVNALYAHISEPLFLSENQKDTHNRWSSGASLSFPRMNACQVSQ